MLLLLLWREIFMFFLLEIFWDLLYVVYCRNCFILMIFLKNILIFCFDFWWWSLSWKEEIIIVFIFMIIWIMMYIFSSEVFLEFVGRCILMMDRKIVKDRNIVIVNDIFFLVFVGMINIRRWIIFSKIIGEMRFMMK